MPDENISLDQHEAHSEQRAHMLGDKIDGLKGYEMSGHEKVVINNKYETAGDGEGGGMGNAGGMAAVIAALGSRNEPGNGIAALAPLLMGANRGHDGLGGLAGAAVGFVAGAVLGGGRRGILGGGEGGDGGAESRIQTNADTLAILGSVGRVGDAVAATGATNTINLLQQTNEIQGLASAAALANAAGFAATERSVTNSATVLAGLVGRVNENVLEQGCATRAAILASETAILSRIDRAEIDSLRHERDRFERSVEVNALRSTVEVNQTVNTTQSQAQAQFQVQAQFQDIGNTLRCLAQSIALVHQEARSTNANIIAGNAGAVTTGAQTSTPTNVNA